MKNGVNEDTWTHTYYVRDAQGNALAVYSSALVQSGSQYTATLKACPEQIRRIVVEGYRNTPSTAQAD